MTEHRSQTLESAENADEIQRILNKLTAEERAVVSRFIEKELWSGLYKTWFILYTLIVVVLLLWPFDFVHLPRKNGVRWIEDSRGIEFPRQGQIISPSSTENLYSRLVQGSGLSLELWVAAENDFQTGPARIISYSQNAYERNFTLAQDRKKIIMRLRTTRTDLNGKYPHFEVDNVFGSLDPQHIVVTYDFSQQSVYVNGKRRARQEIPGGTFSNWDPSYHLVFGNEATGYNTWLGKIFFAGIYNRPLDENEVRQKYLTGLSSKASSSQATYHAVDGLVVRYFFDEGEGDTVGDSSGADTPLDLHIPNNIQVRKKPYLAQFSKFSAQKKQAKWSVMLRDAILNIIIFIPLGFLLHAILRINSGSSLKTAAIVLVLGTLFSLCVESIQYFSIERCSSFLDLICNMAGTALGIATDRSYVKYLKSRAAVLRAG